jgi:hypothetical protein
MYDAECEFQFTRKLNEFNLPSSVPGHLLPKSRKKKKRLKRQPTDRTIAPIIEVNPKIVNKPSYIMFDDKGNEVKKPKTNFFKSILHIG